jgi:PAS domain S-box-containing protein
VLESITDGFIALNGDWTVTYANVEAERLNGMRREDMLGKNFWDSFAAAVGTQLETALRSVAAQRVPDELDYYYEPWQRWFHVKAYPATEGGLSIFYEDITARKVAEQERAAILMREREALSEARTLNAVARALAAELDLQKLVQSVTDAGTKETGAQVGAFFYNALAEDGESYVLYTLSGAPKAAFENFGLPRNTAVFEPTFRGAGIVRSDDILKDPRYGTAAPHHGMPPGHLPVRSYLAAPVISRSGQVLGGLFFGHADPGIFTERSERLAMGIASHASIAIDNAQLFAKAERELVQRKEAEALMRESEQRFREVAEVGPHFVWVNRPDGSVEYVNRRWVEYSGPEDTAAQTGGLFEQGVHPADQPELQKRWQESLKTGEPFEAEARLRQRDGAFGWFVVRGVPLRDNSGIITKWVGAATDIHEQKRVEDELRQANLDLEQFAYSASHDLQEPLRSVKIYGELLSTRYASKLDGQALQFLEFLRDGAGRMENLVSDLLAYTQVSRVDLPQEKADANEALADTLANLEQAIAESAARITVDRLPSLPVHRAHLQQLFLNLIANAIKYRSTDRTPAIHISARQEGQHWAFSVSDNGIGIQSEYRERIFVLFKRRIVERYQGNIGVDSEPGQGSTFTFRLPV